MTFVTPSPSVSAMHSASNAAIGRSRDGMLASSRGLGYLWFRRQLATVKAAGQFTPVRKRFFPSIAVLRRYGRICNKVALMIHEARAPFATGEPAAS